MGETLVGLWFLILWPRVNGLEPMGNVTGD